MIPTSYDLTYQSPFSSGISCAAADIRKEARDAYKLFEQNPSHPSLRFKPVHPSQPIYSVRITRDYRALGVRDGDEIVWFWIGTHAEYDNLISRL